MIWVIWTVSRLSTRHRVDKELANALNEMVYMLAVYTDCNPVANVVPVVKNDNTTNDVVDLPSHRRNMMNFRGALKNAN